MSVAQPKMQKAMQGQNGRGGNHGPNKFQKPKNVKKTLKRLLGYLAQKWYLLFAVAILVLVSAGANVAGTYILGKVVINNYILPLIGTNPTADAMMPLIKVIVSLALMYLFGVLAQYAYSRIMLNVSHGILYNIRKDLFNHMQDLPIKFFDTHTHGELMSRYTNDVDTLREAISQGFVQLISSVVTVVGTFIMMLVISPILILLILVMLVIMLLIIKTIGGKSAHFFRKQQQAIGAADGYVTEMTEGQKVVKVFVHEENAKQEFDKINEELRTSSTNAHTYASVIMPIMGNISYFNYAATAIIGSFLMINGGIFGFGALELGGLISFLQYTRQFSQPITQISQQFNSMLAALAGAERIFEIIDTPVETDEGYVRLVNAKRNEKGEICESDGYTGEWAWKHPHENGTVTYTKLTGDVRFENVTFSYDGENTVLKNISLYAKPGQKIAFVGSTGAGKTTITNLINRFYDIENGKIRYDGINIKKIKKDDLRRSLSMVLQDTHLFTGTVEENIKYGKLDATHEEVLEAAKLANADSFISRLPQGYDTMLVSDGTNLSQGQRQLIAIARAAIANPPVLILDEATSSIDTRTEALIEKGMDKLMDGRTVFVIAHRLSTVRNSNAIMVLENGDIIERGDHDDLIEQRGKYYQLYTGQFELT